MTFSNRNINQLALHATLASLAWSVGGTFFMVFLLKAGLPPAQIFLTAAAILALRFVLRPLVAIVASRFGLQLTLIFGTSLCAFQFLTLPFVHAIDISLVLFCAVTSLSQVFYNTCYHVYFSSLGDNGHRGKQIGIRQIFGALAGVVGPAAGGVMLTISGPWIAFGVAFLIQVAAIFPLLKVEEPKLKPFSFNDTLATARTAIGLYLTDGWIQTGSALAWSIIMFNALAGRYDDFGGALSLAALAGALGGYIFGRYIDLGHARHGVWPYAAILAASLVLKSICGHGPLAVVVVATVTTFSGGFYIIYWMTTPYNEGKNAPCTFRFQFACEGGWDIGGSLAGVTASIVYSAGLPLELIILLGLPMVAVQAVLLNKSYRTSDLVASNQSVPAQ